MMAVRWKRGMLADHAGQFKAVDLRHADVHEHNSDVGFQQKFQRFFSRVPLSGFHPSSPSIAS